MTVSALATDAYKFSMAQAGFPLRTETFYMSLRFGGLHYVPIDLAQTVRDLVAAIAIDDGDVAFLRGHGYGPTDAMLQALRMGDALEIRAVPAGAWVCEREPLLSVTGPSFLASWLEPMLLWLNYPIQLATHLMVCRAEGRPVEPEVLVATCAEHEAIIRRIAAALRLPELQVAREDDAYRERVAAAVRELIAAASGDPARIFEVGMRSAVCMEQHRIALSACRSAGVVRTGNLALARELDLVPVGSMAHEHVQRWGADLPAFLAMRDMRIGAPSYLLDTFDTMGAGIAAALQVMQQRPHACSIRYDSGNKFIQYLHACELFREARLEPAHVLEDGLDVEATRHFERLREFTSWSAEHQHYGYGGSIVSAPATHPLSRDRVSAVYKLSDSGGQPCMKFANDRGGTKQSVPGRPVVWRRLRGEGPLGVIGQVGEPVATDYVCLTDGAEALDQLRLCNVLDFDRVRRFPAAIRVAAYSPATQALVDRLRPPAAHG